MPKFEITKGSISDLMQREDVSLAESFLSCDCVVLFDVSGSMENDDGTGKSRFDRGCDQLRELQASMPGKIAVVQFADRVQFMPGGVPVMDLCGYGTDLADGLRFIRMADVPDMRFVVISDGAPDSESMALAEAKRFDNKIDTVYIGKEDGFGKDFLYKLASVSGGSAMQSAAENIKQDIVYLLNSGN
jgi:hypothetical protein